MLVDAEFLVRMQEMNNRMDVLYSRIRRKGKKTSSDLPMDQKVDVQTHGMSLGQQARTICVSAYAL